MTTVEKMLQELKEKFPKQMTDMYNSNQLLFEDIILKAKEMEKIEKIKVQIEALKEIDVPMNGWVTHQIFEKLKEFRKQLKESELTFKSE